MYFCCTSFPQQTDDPLAGRAADNTVIYQNNTLACHNAFYHIQLDPHGIRPHLLIRLDKGSADIAVLDKADFIWDSRSL